MGQLMARLTTRARAGFSAPSVTELHRAWLELVDVEGPFLAIPPLKRVWPQGMPSLGGDRKAALVDARSDFETAWEKLDRAPDDDAVLDVYRVARDKWVETVLRDVAGWGQSLSWGEVPGVQAQSPNRAVTVTAQGALDGVDGTGALVHVVDPTDSLRQTPNDLWAATPVDRTEALLRENRVQLGIVTDGRWWGLVSARDGAMAASGVVDALTWVEEPRTRDAFLALIGRQHIIGGDPAERLPVLFEESVAAAEEITEALGSQVRSAVELLIQSFSESAADARRRGLPDPLPLRNHDTYEAAVTVMMRGVFLLFAEERGLLPSGGLFDQGYGIAHELDRLIARETEESEEALDATSLTWHRLLSTSQALFSGASFEGLRMPAYGGSLFDPARSSFLTATNEQGTLAVTVSDRVMLHVLRSVQIASIKGEARRISFRDVDVEQIGYIYEGLLGYTAMKVDQTYVGLKGGEGVEPEMPLTKLEELSRRLPDPKSLAAAIRSWVEADQPSAKASSVAAIVKAVTADNDARVVSALMQAVGDDAELRDRVRPLLGLVRLDLRKRPFIVLPGGLMVKETPSRKNAGAHYTPKSLAEEVVLHALQPLCYSPGPHDTADESAWKLKSSDELLDLKVADIACGSGAFLVAAARYLAARLVEAWIAEDPANAARRSLHTRAIRQIVATCLYGADINDMAVEMCKLSLWLVSLDRDLPFSFVDDKVFLGNSLLGITSLDQLRRLHIDPARVSSNQMFDIFDADIDAIVHKAVDLRRDLSSPVDDSDPARSGAAKRRQLAQLQRLTSELRRFADCIVASGLQLGGKPSRGLDASYENLRAAVAAAHGGQGDLPSSFLTELVKFGLTPSVLTDYEHWKPLHWVLEAPDVMVDHGGFDAIVGNPPFLVHKKISAAIGTVEREYLVHTLGGGATGKVDYVSFFLLRAARLARSPTGILGLITSKAVAEGATREFGLGQLVDSTDSVYQIVRAIRSRDWPGSAATQFSAIWLVHKISPWQSSRILDGRRVDMINSMLETGRVGASPIALSSNRGICHQGVITQGKGFFLSIEEGEALLENPSNHRVVRPYLGGSDVSDSPTFVPSRYVLDFGEMAESDAREFVDPWAIVSDRVKPERMTKDAMKYPRMVNEWWKHWNPRHEMRAELANLVDCLVIIGHTKHLAPARVSSDLVPSSALRVFCSERYDLQAMLMSTLHTEWAVHWGSTLGASIRYNPSVVFDTFPIPEDLSSLDSLGRDLDTWMKSELASRGIGLTSLLTEMHESDGTLSAGIARLREIVVAIDRGLIRAYGWTDIVPQHRLQNIRGVRRFSLEASQREELISRIIAENLRRASIKSVSHAFPRAESRRGARNAEALFS